MKRVLIISPYFAPTNAADMQRVRMSLPYFADLGWQAEVVCVDEKHADMIKDPLLLQSVTWDAILHKVGAFAKKWTGKFGLGSLALRSMWHYRKKVNQLLSKQKYDLVYFSTTQFPVCVLGPYWQKRFGIPYVIDMQDPWHSDYYQDKPRHERPPKYWFSYNLNKYLEAKAMKKVNGLISVSDAYINDLKTRYPEIENVPAATITFGYFKDDIKIAQTNQNRFNHLLDTAYTNIVYAGRGGKDMHTAIKPVFKALAKGLQEQPALFGKLKFYFIGTSYAPNGHGIPSILPLACDYGLERAVTEITDRISYFHTLITLQQADALFIMGSDDPKYTASKLYPYLIVQKPLLAIFNEQSNAVAILNKHTQDANVLTFTHKTTDLSNEVYPLLAQWASGIFKPVTFFETLEQYSAKNLTLKQTELFDRAITYFGSKHSGQK